MIKRLLPIVALLLCFGWGIVTSGASQQEQVPAPTLVPPTPVPFADPGDAEILPSESTVSRIQQNGVVRVGILYNAPPFSELNIRGEISGYDADLARSLASTWDVEIEFIQVTRDVVRTAEMLRDGVIDLVAGQVHRRRYDLFLEFSESHYFGGQHVLVAAADPASSPTELSGRALGVVIGTDGERGLTRWQTNTGIDVTVQTYLTLDRAFTAMSLGEVNGIVDTRARLQRVSAAQPETVRVIDPAISLEPRTFAMIRQDINMRNLVNRTLQHLTQNGRMDELYATYFPGIPYLRTTPWLNLGEDVPSPAQFVANNSFPQQYVVPQLQATNSIRVAGLIGVTADADVPESDRRLDIFHRALLGEMASRWGVSVEFVPNSTNNAIALVASGQADIAVNVQADWAQADVVDFTNFYLVHGERLMVQVNDDVNNFSGLRGGAFVATPNNETTAAARAVEIAGTVPVSIEILQVREQDIAFVILEENDAEVAFGDSLRLIPHVQAFPDALRLTTADDRGTPVPWYAVSYTTMAIPRNDIEFRRLVEYTMQELILDGTLRALLQPLMLPEDFPVFEVWPGEPIYLGYNLAP